MRLTPNIVKIGLTACLHTRDHCYNMTDDHGILAIQQRIPKRRAADAVENCVAFDLEEALMEAADDRPIREYFDLAKCAAILKSEKPEDPLEVARDIMKHMMGRMTLIWPNIAADMEDPTQLIHRDVDDGKWIYIYPLPRDVSYDNNGYPEDVNWQPTVADLLGIAEEHVREITTNIKGNSKTTSPLVRTTGLARTIQIAQGADDEALDHLDKKIQEAFQKHAYPDMKALLDPLVEGTSTLMRRILKRVCTGYDDAVLRILMQEHVECTTAAIEDMMKSEDGNELRNRITSAQKSAPLFFKSALQTIMNVDISRTSKAAKSLAYNTWKVTARDEEMLSRVLEKQASTG
jgi:hypothetical protein